MENDIIGTIGAGSINPFVIGEELKKNADQDGSVKDEPEQKAAPEAKEAETKEPVEPTTAQPSAGQTEEPVEQQNYDDYSNAAIIALSLKEDGLLPEDFEVDKNLSGKDLKGVFEMAVAERESGKEEALRAQLETEYAQMGFDPSLARDVLFYRNGGNPQMISKKAQYEQISQYQAKDEDEKEKIVRFMFQDQGLDEDAANLIVDGLNTEEALNKYYSQTKSYFQNKVAEIEKQEEEYNQAVIQKAKQEEEKVIRRIKEVSAQGKVGVFELDKKEAEELVKYMTEASEVIEVPNSAPMKVTPFKKAVLELDNSPERLAELAVFLMKGSKFFDQKATDKAHQDLLSKLDAISSERVAGKSDDGKTVKIEKNISEIIGQGDNDVLFTI